VSSKQSLSRLCVKSPSRQHDALRAQRKHLFLGGFGSVTKVVQKKDNLPRCALSWYYKMFEESQPFGGNTDEFFFRISRKWNICTKKRFFFAGRMSGNEQLGNKSGETRGTCKPITTAHALLCRRTDASALGHLHSPRVDTTS